MSEKETPSQAEPENTPEETTAAAETGDAAAGEESVSEASAAAEAAAEDSAAAGDELAAADETASGDDAAKVDEAALGNDAAGIDEAASGNEAAATDETVSDAEAAIAAALAREADAASGEPDTAASSDRPAGGAVRGLRPGRTGAVAALLAAVAVVIVAAVLWRQFLEGYISGETAPTAAETGTESSSVISGTGVAAGAAEGTAADIRSLEERIAALGEELTASRAELAVRMDRAEALLESLPTQFATLERRVGAVQGSSREAREGLLRAEAEYYLTLANTELALAGRWENAIAALEVADDRLRVLANPALRPVREAIANELIALNAVELPDIEGVVITLGQLSEQAAGLPLRPSGPNRFAAPETGLEGSQPGLDRLWLSIRNALGSVVSVERREAPVTPVLTAAEQQLAKRQLQLELQLARFAATSGRQEAFSTSVLAARTLLEQDFDADSAAVQNAVTLLDELADGDIAPVRPDIGGSLSALRALAAEGE